MGYNAKTKCHKIQIGKISYQLFHDGNNKLYKCVRSE